MGGARGMHKGEEQCIQGNLKARYRLEALDYLQYNITTGVHGGASAGLICLSTGTNGGLL
jgi:hypothetical protein